MENSREQVDRLAEFIMENVPGEPSQSQGAVDTAIRIMQEQQAENDKLRESIQYFIDKSEMLTIAGWVSRMKAVLGEETSWILNGESK